MLRADMAGGPAAAGEEQVDPSRDAVDGETDAGELNEELEKESRGHRKA